MRRRLLALLDLPASADAAAVKARYRALAKAHHPDVNPGSAEHFASITAAYQQLLANRGEDASERDARAADHDPAMQARWNIRRKVQPGEYPAWFKPDDG